MKNHEFFEKQIIILVSLISSNYPINGTTLSRKCSLSVKTIKKEIDKMNNYLPNQGFLITSKSGHGYEIEITDDILYEHFKANILDKYHRNYFFKNNQEERVHFIIRCVLSRRGPIFIEDFADNSYVSTSVISRDMYKVKDILKQFNLQLKNKTNNGLIIQGNEWNKRLALINEHRIYAQYFEQFLNNDEYDFANLFLPKTGSYQALYHIVKKQFMKHNVVVPFFALPKIVYLIMLSITRRNFNEEVNTSFSRFDLSSLNNAYLAVINIYEELHAEHGVTLEKSDAASVTVYINSFETITDNHLRLMKNQKDIEKYTDGVISHLDQYLDISQYPLDQLKQDLFNNLSSMVIRNNIGVRIDSSVVSIYIRQGLAALDYCYLLYKYIVNEMKIDCSIYDAIYFFHIFTVFRKQNLLCNRKKVAVVSRYGYLYARNMANKFERQERIGRLNFVPMEFLQLTDSIINGFDCIATDIDKHEFQIDCTEIIPFFYFKKKHEFDQFYASIDSNELPIFTEENIHYIGNINSLGEVFNFLECEIYSEYPMFVHSIKEQAYLINPVKVNQIMVLSSIEYSLDTSFIEILAPDKPFKVHEDLCSFIVIYNSQKNSILISEYLNELISNLMQSNGISFTGDLKVDFQSILQAMSFE